MGVKRMKELLEKLKEKKIKFEIREREEGVKKKGKRKTVLVYTPRENLRDIVKMLIETSEDFPHFSVCSFADYGDYVELNYHFSTGYGKPLQETNVILRVTLKKDDLRVPTITDLVPATIFSEREIKEMTGIEIENIPDGRHMFLTKDFPDGVYPWRRDETAPKETRKMYEVWK